MRLVIGVNLLLILPLNAAFAAEPVMIGREAGYDACGAISETHNLAQVHADPSRSSKIVDTLASGIWVWDCDWKDIGDESWSGVVYSLDRDEDCGPMGTPIPEAIEYSGPCKYGWINRDDLTHLMP